MKTLYKVSYTELDAAAINAGYELIEVIDGCLVDSVLYCKEAPGVYPIYIAGFETYLNANSRVLAKKWGIRRQPGSWDGVW